MRRFSFFLIVTIPAQPTPRAGYWQIHIRHCDKCDLHVQDEKHVFLLCPCLGMCYRRRKFAEQFAAFTGTDRTYIGDTGAYCFDNINAEDVKLFILKQTYSLLFLSETMDIFCLAGSAQQAQQSTHLAEGLTKPIVT